MPDPQVQESGPVWEWAITFTLAPGFDENDATDLLDYIEDHAAVSGAVLTGSRAADAEGSS